MTAVYTAEQILDVTHGRIARGSIGDLPGRLVWELDDITQNDWFVAMSFGTEDSHDALSTAIDLGAQGCIVNNRSRYCFAPADGTLISVADTEIALLELARCWRDAAPRLKVVTVTGTTVHGRQNTMSFLEFLLRGKYRCHTALERGALRCLPDVLSMPEGTELLIAEVSGVNRGDIARIGSCLNPDLAIITTTKHPLPSEVRDARVAALNCEILETINKNGMAVVYDRNPAVQERASFLLNGLRSIRFSEESQNLSKSSLTWLVENSGITQVEKPVEVNAWCAVTAAVCLGFSLEENPHIVSEAVVNAC